MQENKISSSDFWSGGNIHSDREIFPPLKLQHFFTDNISKNGLMIYNINIGGSFQKK